MNYWVDTHFSIYYIFCFLLSIIVNKMPKIAELLGRYDRKKIFKFSLTFIVKKMRTKMAEIRLKKPIF